MSHQLPEAAPPQPSIPKGSASPEPNTCRECRRRKVKCDGIMPVCTICQKYRRHCLYDKHSRTRLTRMQLTILEERLEKAEALLRRHYTDSQITEMLDGVETTATRPDSVPTAQTYATSPPQSQQPIQLPTPTLDAHPPEASTSNPTVDLTQSPFTLPFIDPDIGITSTIETQPGLLDLTSSVAEDLEWNEQESSWCMYDPNYASTTDSVLPSSVRNIMDGMASLTVKDHNRGYLGAASGAALLHQILSARPDGEGVDAQFSQHQIESLFQDNADQSRWLRTQTMTTRVVVGNLIDAFFDLYHTTFPIVHEPTFRAQYAGTLPCPNKDKWNVLANIVAALGSFASSNSSDATDLLIFQAAQKGLFSEYLEVGNLTLVQGFGLAANYLQKRNKPNSGYNYGGMALRMAISLGLHKEFEGATISPLQKEIRRRVWWCLCVLDVGATITYGRPLNWPQAGVEVALPQNIFEEELESDSSYCPPEVDKLTLYSYIRVQSSYHLSTMSIYNRLITHPFPSASELVALDDICIGTWLAQVPDYFSNFPPRESKYALGIGISKWRYRNLKIVMYRPFLVRWACRQSPDTLQGSFDANNLAVYRCLDAAKETISSIQEYWTSRSHSRLAAWYILYFLFHATLIPVHCLRQNPFHPLAPDWRSQVKSSLAIMDAMSEINPNSSKCRDISLKLCWPHLEDRDPHFNLTYATIPPRMADCDTAAVVSGYDTWCEMMSNASTGAPIYQWAGSNDQALSFFL